MKSIAISFLLIITILGNVFSQVKRIKSKVVSATVYSQGAQVTRVAQVNIDKGENNVIFTNLSPTFDESSVQVSCGEVTIVSVSCQKNMLDSLSQNEEYLKLQSKKKELEKRVKIEKALLQTIDTEKDVLLSNKQLVGDQGVKLEDLKNSLIYFRTRLEELERSRVDKADLIANLEVDLRKIEEQSQVLSTQKIMNTSEILVTLTAEQAIAVNAKIKYFTRNAGWYPSYDVRANSINDPLTITCKANVYQTTGENWDKVKLSFSSGNPTTGSTAPTISPWFIDILTPYAKRSLHGAPGANSEAYDKEMVMEPVEEDKMDESISSLQMPVSISDSQTNFTFNINIPYDIPSKRQPVIAVLQTPTIKASYQYVTIPKLSEYAYLVASMADWQGLNLLNGNANLYFENNYVGSTYLDIKAFGDTLKLSLGKDESISVKRIKAKTFTEKNLIGSKVTETRAWEITISNGKKQDINIYIEDQIPVSTNEKVKVKLFEQGGSSYATSTGIMNWVLNLKPVETKKLQFSYSVEYPKGNQVVLE